MLAFFFHFGHQRFYKFQSIEYRAFLFLLFSIILILNSNKIHSKSPEQIIKDSISQYPGKCPCPYSVMNNGKKCGKKSAYSKRGGFQPLCYLSDIEKKEKKIEKKRVRVVDGDTIIVDKVKYRLHGIDAPEIDQKCELNKKKYECGLKSKDQLKSLTYGKKIKCKQKDIDKYNRIVAVCFADNLNLNKKMVKSGWAIAYRYYSKDYVKDEIFAANNKLGIWEGSFIKPYIWRKKNKNLKF